MKSNRTVKDVSQLDARYLYVSPVGRHGKEFLKKIISRFGHNKFDYLLLVYDEDPFEEDIFKRCTIIREKGSRWYFMKKYATPQLCLNYQYIFVWPDDIDIEDFSCQNFISIMTRNNLQVAQPALTQRSHASHNLTIKDKSRKIGRYVDFVEIMVPVFTAESWSIFWHYIDPEKNPWGWGNDELSRSLCGYTNMGIIDCESVTHTKPFSQESIRRALVGWNWFKEKHAPHKTALKQSVMNLK